MTQPKRILVVDDDDTLRGRIKKILQGKRILNSCQHSHIISDGGI